MSQGPNYSYNKITASLRSGRVHESLFNDVGELTTQQFVEITKKVVLRYVNQNIPAYIRRFLKEACPIEARELSKLSISDLISLPRYLKSPEHNLKPLFCEAWCSAICFKIREFNGEQLRIIASVVRENRIEIILAKSLDTWIDQEERPGFKQISNLLELISPPQIDIKHNNIQKLVDNIPRALSKTANSASDLASLIRSSARLNVTLPTDAIIGWNKAGSAISQKFNLIDLVDCLYYFSKLGITLDQKFIDSLNKLLSSDSEALAWNTRGRALKIYSELMIRPSEEALTGLLLGLMSEVDSHRPDSVTVIMRCLAILYATFDDSTKEQKIIEETYRVYETRLKSALDKCTISYESKHRAAIAELTFDGETNYSGVKHGTGKASHPEREATRALERYVPKFMLSTEVWCPATLSHIGIAITNGDNPIYIQIDGPSHYTTNPQGEFLGYNGSTYLQSYLATRKRVNINRIVAVSSEICIDTIQNRIRQILVENHVPLAEQKRLI